MLRLHLSFSSQLDVHTTNTRTTTSKAQPSVHPLTLRATEPLSTPCMGVCRPPLIVVGLTNKTRTAGTAIINTCAATYGSNINYYWYKDEQRIVSQYGKIEIVQGGEQMTVLNARPEDSGWYTCQAENSYGSIVSRGYIYIIGVITILSTVL